MPLSATGAADEGDSPAHVVRAAEMMTDAALLEMARWEESDA